MADRGAQTPRMFWGSMEKALGGWLADRGQETTMVPWQPCRRLHGRDSQIRCAAVTTPDRNITPSACQVRVQGQNTM
eukprot:29023-Chlamydomonas_euryale.AAC.2